MRANLPLLLLCSSLMPLPSNAGAIHDAAKQGDTVAIAAALDAGADVNESDGSAAPLYYAVRRKQFEAAKLLIERGADINASSQWGPALMPAVGKGQIDLINLLLANGANPNSAVDGLAALHLAAKSGCLDCVTALVEAGADVNALSNESKTPIHLAKVGGHDDVAGYLMAHGVILPRPAAIARRLAAADMEKGAATFSEDCAGCHTIDPKAGGKIGPNLWGVVGRDKASVEGQAYSEVLKALEGAWTYEDLNVYLFGPMLTTPGVYMETPGVPDDIERADVIAYLRTLSDKPIPLP
jgi:cytochrome c